jgi:hypothetical protein
MIEIAHGFAWRLTCDVVLTTGSQEAQIALEQYLARRETAITSSSYLGASIQGRWCPNFAYHFKVASNWPTCRSLIEELAKPHRLSRRGQDYNSLTINLYIPVHCPFALVTQDKKTSDAHHQPTPKYSYPCILEPIQEPPIEFPVQLPLGLPPPAQPRHPPTQSANPYYPTPIDLTSNRCPFNLPIPAQLYLPPAHIPGGRQPYGPSSPAQRDLSGLLGPVSSQAQSKYSDLLTALILTAQSRSKATPNFLNCCCLLTHHDPAIVLTYTNTGQPLASSADLFPCQPTEHFHCDVP